MMTTIRYIETLRWRLLRRQKQYSTAHNLCRRSQVTMPCNQPVEILALSEGMKADNRHHVSRHLHFPVR